MRPIKMIYFLVAVFWNLQESSVLCQETVSVTTPLGVLTGQKMLYNGENMFTFFGVPYAEPPQRFKKPQPIQPWNESKSAESPKKLCMQEIPEESAHLVQGLEMTEDCLYLDIFIPKSLSDKKAVYIIFPATDTFQTVLSSNEQPKYLALFSDVICVMLSYRVDIFGFLSTGDAVIPGNYGLWDQKLAIEWVKSNIHAFGGDATRITLTGFFVGGMYAGFQTSNPSNVGLFQRVIIHSSFSNSKSAIKEYPNDFAQHMANSLCLNSIDDPPRLFTSQEIYDCLVAVDAADLLDAAKYLHSIVPSFVFSVAPVADNDFINETIFNGLDYLNPIDILVYFVDNDGFFEFLYFIDVIEFTYNVDPKQVVPHLALCELISGQLIYDFYDIENAFDIYDLVCNEYKKEDTTEQSREVVRLIGDYFHYAPIIQMLKLHADLHPHKNRYLGLFSLDGPFPSNFDEYSWKVGSSPGMDILYLKLKEFSMDYGIPLSDEDERIVTLMMKYWGSFVKTGDPNNFDTVETNWPVYSTDDQYYIHFANNYSLFIESRFRDKRMKFWLETVASYLSNTEKPGETTEAQHITEGNNVEISTGVEKSTGVKISTGVEKSTGVKISTGMDITTDMEIRTINEFVTEKVATTMPSLVTTNAHTSVTLDEITNEATCLHFKIHFLCIHVAILLIFKSLI